MEVIILVALVTTTSSPNALEFALITALIMDDV